MVEGDTETVSEPGVDGGDELDVSGSSSTPAPRSGPGVGRLIVAALLGGIVGGLIVGAYAGAFRSPATTGTTDVGACIAVDVASTVLPSIVTIQAISSQGSGSGTGELIRPGGYILTNDHVISSAADGGRYVVLYGDGTSTDATLVGRDPATDLAVIKATDGADGRPLIALGSSGTLKVGQPVVALGAPLGLHSTVTHGIVSALDRYVPVPGANGVTHHLIDAIQTDASINPGNSGGALVDCDGKLVGVNSAIITVPNSEGVPGGGSVGLGFAIPVDLADPLAQELVDHGQVNHPTFGLQVLPIVGSAAASAGLPPGLFVSEVDPGGPADKAGLKPGDIITTIDGQRATSVAALELAAISRAAGDSVTLGYVRDGAASTSAVVLAAGS
jgi:putative serine protease PepD